jgi:transketolase
MDHARLVTAVSGGVGREWLDERAAWVRHETFEMVMGAGKGHIGGSLSCVEILVALYHGGVLRVDPARPDWSGRDRFVYSKGHACESLYAVLADVGFFPRELLRTYGRSGSPLGSHVDRRIPGVEVSTGSLGHGLGIGAGLAHAAKLDGRDTITVVLLGDGECYEGSVWEAAMFAAHHRLDTLVAIVDRNRQITLEYTEECLKLEPFADKWAACGWQTRQIDGHETDEIRRALGDVRHRGSGRPLVVIADTIKGKGISFMEGVVGWHHGVPRGADVETARRELTGRRRGAGA